MGIDIPVGHRCASHGTQKSIRLVSSKIDSDQTFWQTKGCNHHFFITKNCLATYIGLIALALLHVVDFSHMLASGGKGLLLFSNDFVGSSHVVTLGTLIFFEHFLSSFVKTYIS
mmetsp:Transcript_28472/g.39635  ORF Transcript_28472/g.39635 Transcript_28472/m.39635 type:complete len:114 (+) Transcript_28472:501-842(+)